MEAFRMPFWVMAVAGQVIAWVLTPLIVVTMETLQGHFGDRRMWEAVAGVSFVVAMVMPSAMLGYVHTWKVWVSPGHLRGSDVWGQFVTVDWDSVTAAKPFNLAGIPYLRVFSDESSKVIWLPLLLVGYDRFAELVAEYAGADHPVTLEVLSRLEADA
jgi:hypothetical protein